MSNGGDPDWAIRGRAFSHLEGLSLITGGRIPWREIETGFEFRGDRVRLASRAPGIFKPRQMSAALSVKTVAPRVGRRIWYRDQAADLDTDTGLLAYDLARGGLANATNRGLKAAFDLHAPLIYFRGVDEALYEAMWPVWIEAYSEAEGRVLLAAADRDRGSVSSVAASRSEVRDTSYSVVQARHRNHQAWFSSRTKSAYGYRCAFSGLPLRDLLVGAHIVPDADGGPAAVANGICMSTLHHTAFDGDLIGVDPDLRVHVANRVMAERDGPLLESLKGLDRVRLRVPDDPAARPDPEYLAQRFGRFREAEAGR